MSDLTVRLTVPIPAEPTVGVPALIFARWLPMTANDFISVSEGPLALRLWFDLESTRWASRVEEEDLPRHVNVPVHRVYADIVVADVDPTLLAYIQTRDYSQEVAPGSEALQAAYDDLAWAILSFTIRVLNRLLTYVRSRWGQHWLQEYETHRGQMYSAFGHFEGKATVNGIGWFRFSPTPLDSATITLIPDSRYIDRESWPEVLAYIQSSRRPPLARTLLAGAESLAANGHSRSALTEAVTALEVAIYAFGAHPAVDKVFSETLRDRLGVSTLKAQIERIGLTGSVSYLLPLLLPPDVLPASTLADCREAISQRQNVVHSGQREIHSDVLKRSLSGIRHFCELLERITEDPAAVMSPAENAAPAA